MSEITTGAIGPETKYAVKFEGGKLRAELTYGGVQASAGVNVAIEADAVIDAIKAAIPGSIDDVVLDLLKAALKAI